MKALFSILTLTLTLGSLSAVAAPAPFANCDGDHHGTYLDFVLENGRVHLLTSYDDGSEEKYELVRFTKNGDGIAAGKAQSWAIRQAIKASAKEEYYGLVIIKAKSASGSELYVNLNKFTGENFVITDGLAEKLNCPVDRIRE